MPSEPVFTAHLVDGTTQTGRLRQLDASGALALVTARGEERVIPSGRLFKLTRNEVPLALTPSEGAAVLFPDGDRLYRTVIGAATETTLEIQSYALGNLSIPLDGLLGLVLTLPGEPDATNRLLERVRTEPRPSEVLWLANGDHLTGSFLDLTEKQVKFQGPNGPIELDRGGVVALGFDPALVVYPRPEGSFLELTFADGSRLGVSRARIERGQIVATTRFKAEVRLALGELIQVHARDDAIAYLSERKAAAEQYVAYVGPTRPFRNDRNVEGRPLRLAGQDYDRGLGMQSRTLLAYRLNPGDTRFRALVGLDDSAGPLGSVVFRVLVDGREKFATPPMSVRDTPRPVDVDLTGAKVLILVAEFGARGEVRDFADWVEARVIR